MSSPAPVKAVTPVVSYDCGCGFTTDKWAEAEKHARVSSHILTIHGRVLVEKEELPVGITPPKRKRMPNDEE